VRKAVTSSAFNKPMGSPDEEEIVSVPIAGPPAAGRVTVFTPVLLGVDAGMKSVVPRVEERCERGGCWALRLASGREECSERVCKSEF